MNIRRGEGSPCSTAECVALDAPASLQCWIENRVERGRVGLYGRPGVGMGQPFIDDPKSPGDPQRATIKAHTTSTQPPSPLRNPGVRLIPIGEPLWSPVAL